MSKVEKRKSWIRRVRWRKMFMRRAFQQDLVCRNWSYRTKLVMEKVSLHQKRITRSIFRILYKKKKENKEPKANQQGSFKSKEKTNVVTIVIIEELFDAKHSCI